MGRSSQIPTLHDTVIRGPLHKKGDAGVLDTACQRLEARLLPTGGRAHHEVGRLLPDGPPEIIQPPDQASQSQLRTAGKGRRRPPSASTGKGAAESTTCSLRTAVAERVNTREVLLAKGRPAKGPRRGADSSSSCRSTSRSLQPPRRLPRAPSATPRRRGVLRRSGGRDNVRPAQG